MNKNSLVIFKSKPAKVTAILANKVTIKTLDSKKISLPQKNVQFLAQLEHDFDLDKLERLPVSELELVWELLQDQKQISLEELCQLIFRFVGVNEAYTVWLLVSEGEYFSFNKDFSIKIHSSHHRQIILEQRQQQYKKQKEFEDFIKRLKNKSYIESDEKFLKEIEYLAILRSCRCRFLKYLNVQETESGAYKLLLDIGYWDEFYNPYLYRYKAVLTDNPIGFKYDTKSDLQRVDLTYLKAYAIDDQTSNDPDDAISWDSQSNKMWVHIADPSSSISFDDDVDLEARSRGSNLYLPEKTVFMLPTKAIAELGLGLKQISPALSIGFSVCRQGNIENIEVCFSYIKVTRCSYEFAETNINSLGLDKVINYAKCFTQKRLANGAIEFNLPEIKISFDKDQSVKISYLPKLNSRMLVRDIMLMTGVAIGQFCIKNDIAVPFLYQAQHQSVLDYLTSAKSTADMFAARKKLQKSQYSTKPAVHAGLGLDNYVQVTSPLRRYLDLLVHYQLRNFLNNRPLLQDKDINNIIAQTDVPIKINSQTERYSNLHWKLVYLLHNPNMQFKATVIEKLEKGKLIVSIADLAITKKLFVNTEYNLNDNLILQNTSVNLVTQEAFFKIIEEN